MSAVRMAGVGGSRATSPIRHPSLSALGVPMVLAAAVALGAFGALGGCAAGETPDGTGVGAEGADGGISYADDGRLAFANNQVLLFAKQGVDRETVVDVLSGYGDVSDEDADAGMYVLTLEGPRDVPGLNAEIDRIVEAEPLIEAGSINWVMSASGDGSGSSSGSSS